MLPSRQGFVFAKVNPNIQRNEGDSTLNITYNIVEGTRTYIERIEIVGNSRTEDEVIRRELRLYEGDAFNRVLVDRARRRLTALDYFEKIEFVEEEGSAPDKVVLIVQVMEKSTGSINFSIGFSTVDYVVGSIALSGTELPGQGLRRQDQHDGQLVQPVHRCQLHQSLHVRPADLRRHRRLCHPDRLSGRVVL